MCILFGISEIKRGDIVPLDPKTEIDTVCLDDIMHCWKGLNAWLDFFPTKMNDSRLYFYKKKGLEINKSVDTESIILCLFTPLPMRDKLSYVKEYYVHDAAIKGYTDYCFTVKEGKYTPIVYIIIEAEKTKTSILGPQEAWEAIWQEWKLSVIFIRSNNYYWWVGVRSIWWWQLGGIWIYHNQGCYRSKRYYAGSYSSQQNFWLSIQMREETFHDKLKLNVVICILSIYVARNTRMAVAI